MTDAYELEGRDALVGGELGEVALCRVSAVREQLLADMLLADLAQVHEHR